MTTKPALTVFERDGDTTVSEDGTTTTDEYGVVLTTVPTAEVTITSTAGTGVTVSANSLTFTTANWNSRQTVTVAGVADNTDTPNREVTISHAATSADESYNGNNIDIAPVMVTVVDEDATTVTLADSPAGNVTEGDSKSITVTLGRSLVTGENLEVPLTFRGTATLVTDYTLVGTDTNGIAYTGLDGSGDGPTVTFTGPASATATIMLNAATDDLDDEGTESVQISFGIINLISGLDGGNREADNLNDFAIQEPLRVSIAGGTAVTEANPAVFTVTVNRAPTAVLTVNLTVADDATSDFVAAGDEGTDEVTIAIGATTATFEVATEGDFIDEANGTVTVTLAGGSGYTLGVSSQASVAVNDDDTGSAILSGDRLEIAEDGGTATYSLVLTMQPASSIELEPVWRLGVEDIDFSSIVTLTPPTLTFTTDNWNTAQMVTVTAVNDEFDNPMDRSRISLVHRISAGDSSNYPTGGFITRATDGFMIAVEVTVNDDDTAGITINETEDDTKGVENSGTDTYGVVLDTRPINDVTVTVQPGSGVTVSTMTLTFSTDTWNTAQIITVTGMDDDIDTTVREVDIAHTAASSDTNYSGATVDSVTVDVTDDDPTTVTLAGTMDDIELGSTKQFTITLGRGLEDGEELAVPLTFAGTAARGTAYNLTGGPATSVSYGTLDTDTTPTVTFTGPSSGYFRYGRYRDLERSKRGYGRDRSGYAG